jgi:hypothetical protein
LVTKTEGSKLVDWKPTSLRLSAFVEPHKAIDINGWWQAVVGDIPSSIAAQPRTNENHVEGPFGDANMILETQIGRIDWYYSVSIDPLNIVTTVPVLGSFDEQALIFRDAMVKWFKLQDTETYNRLAFGTELIFQVQSSREAYELLDQILPVDIDVENSSDFLYQINRKRPTTTSIENLVINRLMKWSAFRVQQTIASRFGIQPRADELYACRLELDINTFPEYSGYLPSEKTPDLLDEFITLSKEIISRGDVK